MELILLLRIITKLIYYSFLLSKYIFKIDMGMSYKELSEFGTLRKVDRCGPVSMFIKLVEKWGSQLKPSEVRMQDRNPQKKKKRKEKIL